MHIDFIDSFNFVVVAVVVVCVVVVEPWKPWKPWIEKAWRPWIEKAKLIRTHWRHRVKDHDRQKYNVRASCKL